MRSNILDVIPIGSKIKLAQEVMEGNGFTCSSGDEGILNCEKAESYFPYFEGTIWSVELSAKNRSVSDVRVWIAPM
jgi:hypothetical protein